MVQVPGHYGTGGAADALAPRQQPFRAPSLPAMGFRHMLCLRGEAPLLLCPWMLGNKRSPVIEADEPGTGFDIYMTADQRMRHRVRMFAVQHVIVRTNLRPADINVFIAVWRESLQGSLIQLFVQVLPPCPRRNGRSFSSCSSSLMTRFSAASVWNTSCRNRIRSQRSTT